MAQTESVDICSVKLLTLDIENHTVDITLW